jgi:hypothetical protein
LALAGFRFVALSVANVRFDAFHRSTRIRAVLKLAGFDYLGFADTMRSKDEEILCSALQIAQTSDHFCCLSNYKSIKISVMSRWERIGAVVSVVWVIAVLVRAISGPREESFFVFYIFGLVPIAIGWLIYLGGVMYRSDNPY